MQPHYDVIVIGAGIHGAGVAQAAASMGYKVLVLEQSSIASGTSSRSSKLIHGGLRYLETAQFALVRECLRERRILLEMAPQLVHLLPFYIPLYQSSRHSAWQIALGLRLYQALSGFDHAARFVRLPPAQFVDLQGLKQQDLQAVFQYFDAQTDDRLLTQAVIASAQKFSARLETSTRVTAINKSDLGWQVHFRRSDQQQRDHGSASARCVVNAAGPWVNRVNQLLDVTVDNPAVDLVQGSHVILQRPAPNAAFYVESPQDRRAVFILPWQEMTMVGTTETAYDGDPALVAPQQSEIDYLIACYNSYFPRQAATAADISHSFAGLRVLPSGNGSHHQRKRETLLWHAANTPAYLAIYGGKLTAYRRTAERVMAHCKRYLAPPTHALRTHCIKL